jgi:hypothetical protein
VKEPSVKTNKPLTIKGHAERKTNFMAQGADPVAPVGGHEQRRKFGDFIAVCGLAFIIRGGASAMTVGLKQ